jgi:hypothetical protein
MAGFSKKIGDGNENICQNSNLGGRRFGQDRRVSADPDYKGIEKRIVDERRKGSRKRKSPRFRAKEGTYAAVDSNYSVIGLIKDVNKCGLAFQYVANEKQLAGLLTIDIFCNHKDFYLKDVPFKTISDFYVDSKSPFSTIIYKAMLWKICGSDRQTEI